jgi:hypothetical protein
MEHNADLWIAATAVRLDIPLVSPDGIFRDTPALLQNQRCCVPAVANTTATRATLPVQPRRTAHHARAKDRRSQKYAQRRP